MSDTVDDGLLSSGGATAVAVPAPRARLGRARTAAMAVPALLSALLTASALGRSGALTGVHGYAGFGYDDGVHLGTALDLTRLALPYRDYVFLHPPGIAVLLLPLGAVGRVLGEDVALVLGRFLTLGVGAANVALVAWLVRRRGALAMYVAGLTLALWPFASDVTRTLMAEPFVVFLLLAGTALLAPLEGPPTPRRALWGGVLFGLAVAIRLLAVLPAVTLLVWCAFAHRERLRRVAAGMVGAFAAVVLPFFLAAPGAFIDQVVVAQLDRVPVNDGAPFGERLTMLFGLASQPSSEKATVAIVAAIAVTGVVALGYGLRRREVTPVEWFVLAASVVTVAGVSRTPETFEQYWYPCVAFLAMALGTSVALLVGLLPVRVGETSVRWLGGLVVVVALSALAVPLALHDDSVADRYVGAADDSSTFVQSLVPAGSCAVADVNTILVAADRYAVPGCPVVVDPFGMYLAVEPHAPPAKTPTPSPELVADWRRTLEAADHVVLSVDGSNFIPWTPELQGWFARTFSKVGTHGQVVVYQRSSDG